MSFKTRQLRHDELPVLLEWMEDEQWHVSANILEAFYVMDPQGWIAAESMDGQLIGSITGCILDENTAYGDFFIVRKDWRKKGIGSALFALRQKYLAQRNVGMDAVENRISYNKEHGFPVLSFKVLVFMGHIDINNLRDPDLPMTNIYAMETSEDFEKLFAYDSHMHIIPRRRLLQQWTKQGITSTYIALNQHGHVTGYGCIQPLVGGHMGIGPVFADSDEIAEAIFVKLVQGVPKGMQVGLNVPANNLVTLNIVDKNKMALKLIMYRLYSKENIPLDLKRVYGFTTISIV